MTTRRTPPGPPGQWLLGNLADFRRDMLGFFARCAHNYGDLVSVRLGPRKIHLAYHPDFVEQVLVTENRKFGKSYVFELLRPMLGNGLVNSEGQFWLRQRRLIQPAFNKSNVNSYSGTIIANTQRLLGEWSNGHRTTLHHEMSRLTLGIVGRALMDMDLADMINEIADPVESAMRDFSHRFESAWNPPVWVPTPRNRRAKQNIIKLDAVVNRIIRERRAEGRDHGDLLSKLIAARDEVDQTGMTDRQLRDEVMTLFLAGHETTANALVWTWYLLAQHPEVERKLLAEIATVVGDRWPDLADVPNLSYTEAVIKEAMRLFPPVYAFSRRVLADATIGGYNIPAGTAVLMSQWVIHRDARWFPQPERFLPERWLSDLPLPLGEGRVSGGDSPWRGEGAAHSPLFPGGRGAGGEEEITSPGAMPTVQRGHAVESSPNPRPTYAYFPFGGGPRVCIGNTFAMLELILVLAAIAPRFRFELVEPDKVRPWPSVTLRSNNGIPVVVHTRTTAPVASPA
jgi:cytochrome P450